MENRYRQLRIEEVGRLQAQSCVADDWHQVKVSAGFDPAYVRNVFFGGEVLLGATGGDISLPGGIVKKSGIYNVSVYNCTFGDHTLISNIGTHLANYDIGTGTVIENVGTIVCEGCSTFGNGIEVSVINEAGGREVPIFNELTAQIAYIIAMYRHRGETVRKLFDMIREYAESIASDRGSIGRNCRITNSTSLINIRLGDHVTVESVSSLRNGTINSTEKSPSYIGTEVIASDFIMACSSRVESGSLLRRCFVGEGTVIENGYSAENSLFFANCHCNHGEACAVFAGPYTVTHHRATLLIAGYYSFFNAGSGANQSNHMYKTGPVHQGVHMRGCKFGSDAYILLPARTGAFTLVTGRHYSHYDTVDMPFSYLIDEGKESYLVPGINIRSCGTERDVQKWPRRDKRNGVASDLIHFGMMTPYTANKILRAIKTCERLLIKFPAAEVYTWNRVKINASALKKGLLLYRQAIYAYLGELLSETVPLPLSGDYPKWVDLAGMIAPRSVIEGLLDDIDAGKVKLEDIGQRLRDIHGKYEEYEALWAEYALSIFLNKPPKEITRQDIAQVIEQGEKDRESLRAAVEMDFGRDVAPLMATGYGIDSDDIEQRESDFNAVRGL